MRSGAHVTPKTTSRMAERHEVLFPKLQALTHKIETVARQRPERAVPDKVRAEAEALLFEAEAFRQLRRRRALPLAAPHFGGLAGQLAEALAALVAFEARYTQWDARFDEPVWMVPDRIMKVRRLTPKAGSKAAIRAAARAEAEKTKREADMVDLRAKLVQRLVQSQREPPPSLFAQHSETPDKNLSPEPILR